MKTSEKTNWAKYLVEFFSIFIAILLAFTLENWNENKRDRNTESSILKEISNGLVKDLQDIADNSNGHKLGIEACIYWQKIVSKQNVDARLFIQHYIRLSRDFISIQNTSGYESLKSQGLGIILDDSLRVDIISLYEFDYSILRKLEEDYYEMQYQENFSKDINRMISPNFVFDSLGKLKSIKLPLQLTEKNRKLFLTFLWQIEGSRKYLLSNYTLVEKRVKRLKSRIDKVLE